MVDHEFLGTRHALIRVAIGDLTILRHLSPLRSNANANAACVAYHSLAAHAIQWLQTYRGDVTSAITIHQASTDLRKKRSTI